MEDRYNAVSKTANFGDQIQDQNPEKQISLKSEDILIDKMFQYQQKLQ